jgi:hypothetical protein
MNKAYDISLVVRAVRDHGLGGAAISERAMPRQREAARQILKMKDWDLRYVVGVVVNVPKAWPFDGPWDVQALLRNWHFAEASSREAAEEKRKLHMFTRDLGKVHEAQDRTWKERPRGTN